MPKILIIEDDWNLQDLLNERLTAAGFQVVCANNGRIGLEMVQQCQPDLVLSDIRMPEMDGYEVLKALRQNVNTASLPVIFLTGETNPIPLSQSKQLGINDYLTKPVDTAVLIYVLKEQLARHGSSQMQSLPMNSNPMVTCHV